MNDVRKPSHRTSYTKPGFISEELFRDAVFDHEKKREEVRQIENALLLTMNLRTMNMPKIRDKRFGYEVRRFRERCLWWYEENPIAKMSAEDVFIGSLVEGPEFAKYLDKLADHSFINKVCDYVLEPLDEEYILDGYEGYDSVFLARAAFPWKETSEDILYSLIPEVPIYKNFEKEFVEFLQEHKVDMNKWSHALNHKDLTESTTSFLTHKKKKKAPPLTSKDVRANTGYLKEDLFENIVAERTQITVMPSGHRDSVKTNIHDLGKIKRFTYAIAQITDNIPYSLMTIGSRKSGIRARRVWGPEKTYKISTDIRKCGLTFPRTLGKKMISSMKTVYPDFIETLNLGIQIFESEIFDPSIKRVIKPCRGYCLGMANEFPTLIQSFIAWKYNKRNKVKIDAIAFNDDGNIVVSPRQIQKYLARIGNEGKDELEVVSEIHNEILQLYKDMSLILKPKACWCARSAIFCCEYIMDKSHRGLKMNKIQLVKFGLLNVLNAQTVEQARDLYVMIADEVDIDLVSDTFKNRIAIKWPEVFMRDKELPYSIGGWINTSDQLNRCLEPLDSGDDKLIYAFYKNMKRFSDHPERIPGRSRPQKLDLSIDKELEHRRRITQNPITSIEQAEIYFTDVQTPMADFKKSQHLDISGDELYALALIGLADSADGNRTV